MFFGMTNSLAIFQTIINDIFQDLITKGIVVVYLDNILITNGHLLICDWLIW